MSATTKSLLSATVAKANRYRVQPNRKNVSLFVARRVLHYRYQRAMIIRLVLAELAKA